MQLGAWGSSTGEASNYLLAVVSTYDRAKLTGASNMTRHSDPVIDDLPGRGAATMDDEAREAIWREAVAYYARQEPMIQLLQYVNTWAHRRGLRLRPADGRAHRRHGRAPGELADGAVRLPGSSPSSRAVAGFICPVACSPRPCWKRSIADCVLAPQAPSTLPW